MRKSGGAPWQLVVWPEEFEEGLRVGRDEVEGVQAKWGRAGATHSQRSGSKLHRRPRYPVNRASGGPGMQAVFLDSGQRSCGTGVFLPQRAGNNFQPSKKPACSSVLLPSRVVQALNLNVHALGSQRSPQRDISKNPKGGSGNLVSNNNDNDVNDRVSSQRCVTIISQSRSSSPEIFLPKEWTY
ncbi:hypothetical protein HHK36_020637 [Tetracentron sinense]|uniref:Uncharacterized protein n=1 Tax=Tetracentron sinense TaxID=13715 RepID=A0A835DBT5_TETSI|nr:hypothetical protein HHK36_020637 [Tetracentron sinense]